MEIVLMKRGELDSAAQLATEAFDDYVYMTNYLPEEKERRSSIRRHTRNPLTLCTSSTAGSTSTMQATARG